MDLSLSDARIDLVQEAVDVAIRLGPLADSTMQCRTIGRSRRVLVASRAISRTRGRPKTPDDLAGHTSIRMSNVVGGSMLSLRGRDGLSDPHSFRRPSVGRSRLGGPRGSSPGPWDRGRAPLAHRRSDGGRTVEQILPDFMPDPVPLSLLVVPGLERASSASGLLVDALATSLATLPGLIRE